VTGIYKVSTVRPPLPNATYARNTRHAHSKSRFSRSRPAFSRQPDCRSEHPLSGYKIYYTWTAAIPGPAAVCVQRHGHLDQRRRAATSGLAWLRTNPVSKSAARFGCRWLPPVGSVPKAVFPRDRRRQKTGTFCSPRRAAPISSDRLHDPHPARPFVDHHDTNNLYGSLGHLRAGQALCRLAGRYGRTSGASPRELP
jgi:hypothetical protein